MRFALIASVTANIGLLIFLFLDISPQNSEPNFEPFNPVFSYDKEELLAAGFQAVPSSGGAISKTKQDVTFYFFFEGPECYVSESRIAISEFDSVSVANLVNKHNAVLISPLLSPRKGDRHRYFFVSHYYNNRVFRCELDEERKIIIAPLNQAIVDQDLILKKELSLEAMNKALNSQ
jgi:hypothetical protein